MPEQKLYTIIAKGTVFQGDINVDGDDIQIWGKISGNINVKRWRDPCYACRPS